MTNDNVLRKLAYAGHIVRVPIVQNMLCCCFSCLEGKFVGTNEEGLEGHDDLLQWTRKSITMLKDWQRTDRHGERRHTNFLRGRWHVKRIGIVISYNPWL